MQLDIIRSDFKSGLEALLKSKPIRAIFLGVRMGDPTAVLWFPILAKAQTYCRHVSDVRLCSKVFWDRYLNFCHLLILQVGQEQFSPSSIGWPPFMRVNPILDWSYRCVDIINFFLAIGNSFVFFVVVKIGRSCYREMLSLLLGGKQISFYKTFYKYILLLCNNKPWISHRKICFGLGVGLLIWLYGRVLNWYGRLRQKESPLPHCDTSSCWIKVLGRSFLCLLFRRT